MSETFVNPTYYNLQTATLRFEYTDGQNEIDITGLIPSVTINSAIDSETMYGSVRVVDSVGLLENTPLRGEEQIILELADSKIINESGGIAEGSLSNLYKFTGFVYKIDNVTTKDANDGIYYDLHFISYQSFKAGTYQITRPFKDLAVSDVASTIFSDYFLGQTESFTPSTDKRHLIVEETSGRIRCVIPRMRPEEAMEFLSKRAYSAADSPSCTYRFFESSRGYHFVTDEHLFRLAEDVTAPDYDGARMFNFTFLDAIPDTLDNFDLQLNNLESIENTDRLNTFGDMYNGAYRNKVTELDILRRQTNLIDDEGQYDYLQSRDRYFDVRKFQKLKDRHTEKFVRNVHRSVSSGRDEDVQKKFIVVANYDRNREDSDDAKTLPAETHYGEIISNRQGYSKHIESISISAVGPGRLDITAGDIINLDVKQLQMPDGTNLSAPERNKHLSGKYIVKSISHRMEQDQMKNYYTMVKKDWSDVELRIGFGGQLVGGL